VNCICVPYIIETETEPHWVECSRKECKQKWFHYQCVEIIQALTFCYYCPLCCFIKYQQKLLDLDQNEAEEQIDEIIQEYIE
jgi:hypothetical protein